MLETLREVLPRSLGGKKATYAQIPVLVNLLAGLFGVDYTNSVVMVVDVAFGALLLAQFALDLRWGSRSDGSGLLNGNGG